MSYAGAGIILSGKCKNNHKMIILSENDIKNKQCYLNEKIIFSFYLTGGSFEQLIEFCELMNICFLGKTTIYQIIEKINDYVIDYTKNLLVKIQDSLIKKCEKDNIKLNIEFDGQHGRRQSKEGSSPMMHYTAIDNDSKILIHIEFCDKNELYDKDGNCLFFDKRGKGIKCKEKYCRTLFLNI